MKEVFLVIKIGKHIDAYQYAIENNGTIEQLVMLNALIDVAKNNIVDAINDKTNE